MPIIEITRTEAMKLIHDRTNRYQIDQMSDERLGHFITEIGYGIDETVPHYGCEFKIKENERTKT